MSSRGVFTPAFCLARSVKRALQPDLGPTRRPRALTRSKSIGPIACGLSIAALCLLVCKEFWNALASSQTVNPTEAGPVGFLILCAAGALLFGGGALYILCQVWLVPKLLSRREEQSGSDPR